MKLLMKKVEIEQVIIAYDALTVVNPANSVSNNVSARANLYRAIKTGEWWC
jgi:hypothetical protein